MTAWTKIEALAAGLIAKTTEAISKEQAVDRVLQTAEGRELYADYLAEGDDPIAATRTGADIQREAQRRQAVLAGRELLASSGYVQKAEVMQGAGADVAWALIEKCAERIVEKSSGDLTKEQAVDKFLKTSEGRELYGVYESARMGASMRATFQYPGVGDERAEVQKADAMGEIERRARELSERDPNLSAEKAIALALERAPELYSAYQLASHGGARDGRGRDVGEQRPTVRKAQTIIESARMQFEKALHEYMFGNGPRPWPAQEERIEKSDEKPEDDTAFEHRLQTVLKEADRRGFIITGDAFHPDDFEL